MTAVPRHDHYQTDSAIIVSVYLKGCRAEDVQCDIKADTLHLKSVSPSPEASLDIEPLWSTVDASQSSSKVLGSKIEIKLQKAIVGLQWAQLKGVQGEAASTPAAIITPGASASASSKSAAPRARSKWDSFKPDEEKDENGKPIEEKDGGIDDFFKKLYADADDDTRRAMMKSYQESGGTALSTNWNEVGKGKVETKPPEGMEAKKW